MSDMFKIFELCIFVDGTKIKLAVLENYLNELYIYIIQL